MVLPLFELTLQWLPWILGGAIVLYLVAGVMKRAHKRRTIERPRVVSELDPNSVERYVEEYYRRRGYAVFAHGEARPGRGVDVLILRGEERLIVQGRYWKARRVGAGPVRELWEVVGNERATGAVLVTGGVYTEEARSFAAGRRLELIDGAGLTRLVDDVRTGGAISA